MTSAPPQFHLDSYLQSIDRLAARHFSKIYLTHFGALEGVDEHWSHYRAAVIGAAEVVSSLMKSGQDEESIRVAYEAFQLEQAFQQQLPRARWDTYQLVNQEILTNHNVTFTTWFGVKTSFLYFLLIFPDETFLRQFETTFL